MLRKLLAFMLIGLLAISHSPITHGAYSSTELLRTRAELLETKDGSRYVSELEILVPQLSTQRLEKISDKISGVQDALSGDTLLLVTYINLLIEKELSGRVVIETISQEEKQLAEKKILSLQKLMKDDILSIIDDVMLAWNEQTRYKEEGDFDMDMMLEIDGVVEASGKLSLSDYMAETQGFDQNFIGKLQAAFQASASGEDMNLSFGSDMDIITKEGQIYLKMKNIKHSNSSEDISLDITPYMEKLEELARDNTYLEITDRSTQMALETFSNFSKDTLDDEINTIFGTALFEAYSVNEDGSYSLRPTRHFCNAGKEMMAVFDPFGGDSCTDSQYENMLDDYYASGTSIEMTAGTTNKIVWEMQESTADFLTTISWNNTKIVELDVVVTGTGSAVGNLFTLNYVPKKHITSALIIDEYEQLNADIMVELTKDGGIKEIDGNFDFNDAGDTVKAKLGYKGSQLDFTLAVDDDDVSIDCSLSGRLDATYANLNGNCEIESSDLSYMIPNTEKLSIDADMELDMRSDKNNVDINITALANGTDKIFEMNMKNVGTRKNVSEKSIMTPAKTKSLEDFMTEIYEERYGDLYDDEFNYDFDSDGYDYDEYSYYDEETQTYYYCNTYEYNETENYDYCTEYITEEEYYEGFEEYEY